MFFFPDFFNEIIVQASTAFEFLCNQMGRLEYFQRELIILVMCFDHIPVY